MSNDIKTQVVVLGSEKPLIICIGVTLVATENSEKSIPCVPESDKVSKFQYFTCSRFHDPESKDPVRALK